MGKPTSWWVDSQLIGSFGGSCVQRHLGWSVGQYPPMTFDQHSINISIDPWLTLGWHSINIWLTVDNRLSVDQHLMAKISQLLTGCRLRSWWVLTLDGVCKNQLTLDWLSKWGIDRVMTEYWSRCQSNVDQDVDLRSINSADAFSACDLIWFGFPKYFFICSLNQPLILLPQ